MPDDAKKLSFLGSAFVKKWQEKNSVHNPMVWKAHSF